MNQIISDVVRAHLEETFNTTKLADTIQYECSEAFEDYDHKECMYLLESFREGLLTAVTKAFDETT